MISLFTAMLRGKTYEIKDKTDYFDYFPSWNSFGITRRNDGHRFSWSRRNAIAMYILSFSPDFVENFWIISHKAYQNW